MIIKSYFKRCLFNRKRMIFGYSKIRYDAALRNYFMQISKGLRTGLYRPRVGFFQRKRIVRYYSHTKDPAEPSRRIIKRIHQNPYPYLERVNRSYLLLNNNLYTSCGVSVNTLLAGFIGKERLKNETEGDYDTIDLKNQIVSDFNAKSIDQLRAYTKRNRLKTNKGYLYLVYLSPAISPFFRNYYIGHVFLIEQLPKLKKEDQDRFQIHQSYLDQYSLRSNYYHMNGGKPLNQDRLERFIQDLETVVLSENPISYWTSEKSEAFKNCFHLEGIHPIGSLGIPYQLNRKKTFHPTEVSWMSVKEFEYDPAEIEQQFNEVFHGIEDVTLSNERYYAHFAHQFTEFQHQFHCRDMLETMKKMYLLIHGNDSQFDFHKAGKELKEVWEKRPIANRDLTVRDFIRKIFLNGQAEEIYQKIRSDEMPLSMTLFLDRVETDFQNISGKL